MASERTGPARTGTRASAWIAVGSLVNGLGALAFQVLGTRALGPDAYAPIGVLWTLQYLWVAVAVIAIEAYVTRHVIIAGVHTDRFRRFLRIIARWLLLSAAVAAVVGLLLRGPLFAGIPDLGLVLGLLVAGYGWYGVLRGRAAGLGDFRHYAVATASESLVRLVAAAVVLAIVATTTSLAWVFPLGPLVVAAWVGVAERRRPATPVAAGGQVLTAPVEPVGEGGPFRLPATTAGGGEVAAPPRREATRFLLSTSAANAAVQFLLAGGPLVLVPLGASAVTISVFFTTVTAARVPMTFALNGGLTRLLPPLVRMARAEDVRGLRRAVLIMVAFVGGSLTVGCAAAAAFGPELVALVFGEAFRPDRSFVVVVAAASVLAVGGLLLDQLYIALGQERWLPMVWWGAVVTALVLVLALPGTVELRVAGGFALASAAAVAALIVGLLHRGSRASVSAAAAG